MTHLLAGISFEVLSPSVFRCELVPSIVIAYDGLGWILTDGQHENRFLSRNAAIDFLAEKFRLAMFYK